MLNDFYHMLDPVAISAGPITIYWYGLAYVVGALLTAVVMYRTQRRWGFNITIDDLTSVVVGVVFGLIIGARLFYVVFYGDGYYWAHPLEIFATNEGGMSFHGGLAGGIIGGAITLLVVAKRKKIPAPVLLDVAGMGVIIGQLMGRWGNFMNREAHGAVTDTFLKMGLQDASGVVTYYHPTFLYESVWNLIGFIGLHFFSKKRKFDGEVFLAYVAWYGLGRVWIEGLRTDSLYLFSTGIRVSQLVAAVSFLAAAGILAWVLVKKKPARESLYVNRKRVEPQADEKQDD